MDGITGLSPEKAQQQIKHFEEAFDDAIRIVSDGYQNFAFELVTKWYSPKAVEFGNFSDKTMSELIDDLDEIERTIIKNSTASYNILARANNIGTLDIDNSSYFVTGPWYHGEYAIEYKEQGPNGEVGMNIMMAKLLVSEFSKKIIEAETAFGEIPVEIAFYDPDGALQQAFKDLINKARSIIDVSLSVLCREVNSAMETEVDNIQIAQQNATDAMNVAA